MIRETLKQAVALHQRGRYDEAEVLYAAVLETDPAQFDALHLMGVLARQRGKPGEAVRLIAHALRIDADQAIAHCNLGAALSDLGEHAQALASYERALALQPDYGMACANRANALRHLGRLDEAMDAYDRALKLAPTNAEAMCNRAVTLSALGRFDEALAGFDDALRARPRFADAWCGRGLVLHRLREFEAALDSADQALQLDPARAAAQLQRANALHALGRRDEAVASFRAALSMGAEPSYAAYMLAALGEGEAPTAAPRAYVAALFDQFAGHFDAHLQGKLAYDTPRLLMLALQPWLKGEALDVLDAGCGTGLCGPLLRLLARRLTGVDLSPRMLDAARARGSYDALICADLVEYLDGASFDLIAAADVLVYIGQLDALFEAVRKALKPGGLFAFSAEADPGERYSLCSSGRYAHSAVYLRQCAAAHGLRVLSMAAHPLREERGRPVDGFVSVIAAA